MSARESGPESNASAPRPPDGSRRRLIIGGASIVALDGSGAWADTQAPDAWPELDVGGVLRLHAPRGTRYVPRAGTDSMVGSIVGEGFVLDVDYGAYSDRLDNLAPYERAEAETIEVGGKRARLVRGTLKDVTGGERHFYGLHVAAIAPSAVGPLALTLTAKVRNRATLDLLTQMVRSIRFKPAP